jgi:hypothetical protein
MKYARKQVTDHGHATLEGVRGIRTDVPIRSSVRSPFPFARIKSKQLVRRLNADLLDGYHAIELIAPTILRVPQVATIGDLPAFGTIGRLFYVIASDALYLDIGTEWVPLAEEGAIDWSNINNKPSTFAPTAHDDSAHTGSIIPDANQDFQENEALAFRVENIGTLPTAGNKGRLVCLTTDNKVYYDTGSAWVAI